MKTRRPISRRLMTALFLLMIVPICGWYFVADIASRELLDTLSDPARTALLAVRDEIRLKLAATLGVSIVTLAGVLVWLRRTLLDPLEDLAERATRAGQPDWAPPPQLGRGDEIGDLAVALDDSIRRLAARAEEAEALATDLSHQLRTPLTAIQGAAEILCEQDLEADDRQRFAHHVLVEAQRLERLVGGLLALARAKAASLRDTPHPFELVPVVEEAIDRISPLLEAEDHRIELETDHNMRPVAAEADGVARILLAVLENAIRHSPAASAIRVRLRVHEDHAEVAVDDSGKGVVPELRERVFERSFTTTGGSGLGLAIARSLVESYDGRIWVTSSPDGGASFRFTLPLAGGLGLED